MDRQPGFFIAQVLQFQRIRVVFRVAGQEDLPPFIR